MKETQHKEKVMNKLPNGIKFTYSGHPSQFKGYVVERHPSMTSMAKRKVFDCRTKEIIVKDFCSAGNSTIFAIINGQDVQVLPYGRNVRKALEQYECE